MANILQCLSAALHVKFLARNRFKNAQKFHEFLSITHFICGHWAKTWENTSCQYEPFFLSFKNLNGGHSPTYFDNSHRIFVPVFSQKYVKSTRLWCKNTHSDICPLETHIHLMTFSTNWLVLNCCCFVDFTKSSSLNFISCKVVRVKWTCLNWILFQMLEYDY